jgi:leader peptidase (prepilin peptidase) / N-methyltransferase
MRRWQLSQRLYLSDAVGPKRHFPAFALSALQVFHSLVFKYSAGDLALSIRYFLVEFLTGTLFLACWLSFGRVSAVLAVIYAIFLAGLVVATFVDFEHFIIPDEISIGGAVLGFLFSFLYPPLHDELTVAPSIKKSLLGIILGALLIYLILRAGKLLFGRQKLAFPAHSKIVFTETAVELPDKSVPYDELFYRESDTISMRARTVELIDRCYKDVLVQLSPSKLRIGEEELDPEQVMHLEAVSEEIVLPREAMGLGDVKFMAGIGAFLGWKAVVFSLMVSSMIGSLVGVTLIALRKQAWSSRLPYGPYIAAAAAVWVFGGKAFVHWWLSR